MLTSLTLPDQTIQLTPQDLDRNLDPGSKKSLESSSGPSLRGRIELNWTALQEKNAYPPCSSHAIPSLPPKESSRKKRTFKLPDGAKPILPFPRDPTQPFGPSLDSLALSPRSASDHSPRAAVYKQRSVKKTKLELLPEEIALPLEEIKQSQQSPYGMIDIQEMEQTIALFFHQNIREILTSFNLIDAKIPMEVVFDVCGEALTNFRAKMESEDSPLVFLCLLPLRGYISSLPDTNPFFVDLRKVMGAMLSLNVSDIKGLEMLDDATPLEKLISIFRKYSRHRIGTALSYIIFGSRENQIGNLLRILESWNRMDEVTMKSEIDEIRQNPVYRRMSDAKHQFKLKDICDTFCRDGGSILPRLVMINYLPLQLKGYTGENRKIKVDFYLRLIGQIYYGGLNPHIRDDQLQQIVNELIDNEGLPNQLTTLLGLSSISSRIQAFEYFITQFPLLNGLHGVKCRQKEGNVQIFFNIKSLPMNCYQPMTIIIYPKLRPDHPESFAIDMTRPLAEITFGWTGFLFRAEDLPTHYTHSETLEIQHGVFKDATEEEQKFIIDALSIHAESSSDKKRGIVSILGKAFKGNSDKPKPPSSPKATPRG
ncbi:MAG: hypothetical protein K2X08_00755, partial [Chlamydiales bacterium]|nr:hypothetical protein [Chlamydiales bacterium]